MTIRGYRLTIILASIESANGGRLGKEELLGDSAGKLALPHSCAGRAAGERPLLLP